MIVQELIDKLQALPKEFRVLPVYAYNASEDRGLWEVSILTEEHSIAGQVIELRPEE